MKKSLLSIIFFLSFLSASVSSARDVDDFALIDHEGGFHQLSRYAHKDAIVLYVYGNNCSVSDASLPKLSALADKYDARNIEFLMIDPVSGDDRQSVKERVQGQAAAMPVLMDSSQLVASSLGVHATGEVFVIDPQRMTLLYRGAIDNLAAKNSPADQPGRRDYLDEVLSAVVSGSEIIADVEWTSGTPVTYDFINRAIGDGVSYADDVAPILERRCVSCHVEGGVAPWAMSSHEMVSGWSAMIRETVMTMRMPPGQIDNTYLDNFVDVHYITDEEKAVLVRWAEEGAVRDSETDPLTTLPLPDSEWALGEPDLIIEFPAQEIPATGVLDYKYVPVEIGLSQDRWVRAYEFDIGDKAALHHVVAYTQDQRQQRQNASGGGSRTNFGGYAPGREYVEFDDGTGVLLQRDMRFMVQFHYTAIGRPVVDKTRIGLYFHDEKPERPLARTAVMNGEFVIPPGAENYPVTARALIANDSYLYNLAPHMHYRGKQVKYSAEYPDGTVEDLLSIPNFQHNWQMIYRLKQPKFLPAGTVIVAQGAFDNSPHNALNPDPTKEVLWGDQVWDEMFIAWMRVSEAD